MRGHVSAGHLGGPAATPAEGGRHRKTLQTGATGGMLQRFCSNTPFPARRAHPQAGTAEGGRWVLLQKPPTPGDAVAASSGPRQTGAQRGEKEFANSRSNGGDARRCHGVIPTARLVEHAQCFKHDFPRPSQPRGFPRTPRRVCRGPSRARNARCRGDVRRQELRKPPCPPASCPTTACC